MGSKMVSDEEANHRDSEFQVQRIGPFLGSTKKTEYLCTYCKSSWFVKPTNIWHNGQRGHLKCSTKNNYEDIITRLKNKNISLISDYTTLKDKHKLKCHCGKIFETTLRSILEKNSYGCGCKRKHRRSFKHEEVFNKLLNKGFTLLENYKGERELKHNVKCFCGKLMIKPIGELLHYQTKSCGCLSRVTEEEAKARDKSLNRIRLEPISNTTKKHRYLCSFCNKEYMAVPQQVWNGSSLGHRGCSNMGDKTGHKELVGKYWYGIKSGAKSRGIKLEINIEDAYELFQKQNGKCNLTGKKIELRTVRNTGTASLDRIDNSKGYIKGNLQWIHKKLNFMKGKLTQEEFIEFCKAVAAHNQESTCQTNTQH